MSDSEYFERRSQQEMMAADSAPNPRIAAIHVEMANLYQAAAQRAGEQQAAVVSLFRRSARQ